MDATTLLSIAGLAFTSGTGLVSVTIYAANTRSIAKSAEVRALDVEQELEKFARKESIEPRLDMINASLKRIEDRQDALLNKLLGGGA